MFNKNSNNLWFLILKLRIKWFIYNKNVIINSKSCIGYNISVERFNICIGYKVKYIVLFLYILFKLYIVKG